MKKILFFVTALSIVCLGSASAQFASPVKLDIGLGGGLSLPAGDIADSSNSGYHFGAKLKLHGFMPLNVVASGIYNRIPDKTGSEAATVMSVGAGLEYPLAVPVVTPYFSADAMVNIIGRTDSGSTSMSRFGIGIGAGLAFSIPEFANIDASVKYQMFNLAGREDGERKYSQVTATLMLMFSVL